MSAEVFFVGTSDAFSSGGRRNSAILVRSEGQTLLLDCLQEKTRILRIHVVHVVSRHVYRRRMCKSEFVADVSMRRSNGTRCNPSGAGQGHGGSKTPIGFCGPGLPALHDFAIHHQLDTFERYDRPGLHGNIEVGGLVRWNQQFMSCRGNGFREQTPHSFRPLFGSPGCSMQQHHRTRTRTNPPFNSITNPGIKRVVEALGKQ